MLTTSKNYHGECWDIHFEGYLQSSILKIAGLVGFRGVSDWLTCIYFDWHRLAAD